MVVVDMVMVKAFDKSSGGGAGMEVALVVVLALAVSIAVPVAVSVEFEAEFGGTVVMMEVELVVIGAVVVETEIGV